MWTFDNETMKLSDKANLFNSSDKWKLSKIEGTFGGYTIEHFQEKFVDITAQKWEQSFPKNGKYFTLANLDNKKLLTATSDDQLAIKGN